MFVELIYDKRNVEVLAGAREIFPGAEVRLSRCRRTP